MGTKALMTDHATAAFLSEVDKPPQRKEKLKIRRHACRSSGASFFYNFLPAIDGIFLLSNRRFNGISYVHTLHFGPNVTTQPSSARLGFHLQ